jgi:hypothetical protein
MALFRTDYFMSTARSALVSLLLALLLPVMGLGQPIRGGAIYLYGGLSAWPGSARAIQELTTTNTYVWAGNERYVMLSAEAYYRRNRWLLGINASTLSNKRVADGANQSFIESSASNARVWVGWVAWHTNRATLYPSLGPGLNSFNVNSITPAGLLTTHVLDGFATDIGLTFDWFVLRADEATRFAPMLSVRAGYRLTTASAEWHGDHNGVTTLSPTQYTPQSFYLLVGVGGGSFRHR